MDGKFTNPLVLKELFLTSFIKVWWQGDASFNAPFWMLQTLFFGAFVSVIVTMITYSARKHSLLLILILTGIYIFVGGYNLCAVLGVLLGYLKYRFKFWAASKRKIMYILNIFLLICAICLPEGYKLATKSFPGAFENNLFICNSIFYNILGSFLLIFALMGLEKVKKIMTRSRILRYVGNVSFAVYLVHWPIICSFSCWIYLKLYDIIKDTNQLISLVFVLTIIVVSVSAAIFNKLIEKKICKKVTDKICNIYFRQGDL